MAIQPCLFFNGRCEEALAFYQETFFSPRFGCVADKFGVSWMVMVPQPM